MGIVVSFLPWSCPPVSVVKGSDARGGRGWTRMDAGEWLEG